MTTCPRCRRADMTLKRLDGSIYCERCGCEFMSPALIAQAHRAIATSPRHFVLTPNPVEASRQRNG